MPETVEDKLRLRAFRVFYAKTFAKEPNAAVRFAKAIIASAGPLRDREALMEWYQKHGDRRDDTAL